MSFLLLPDWLDVKLWNGWLEVREDMRKRKGIPFTEHAKQLALDDLIEWHSNGYDTRHVLRESIKNGWRGLFISERTPRIEKVAAPQESKEWSRVRVLTRLIDERNAARFRRDHLWATGCSLALQQWNGLEKSA